jgi:hypothetical protein
MYRFQWSTTPVKTFAIAATVLSMSLILSSGKASGEDLQPTAAPPVIQTNHDKNEHSNEASFTGLPEHIITS